MLGGEGYGKMREEEGEEDWGGGGARGITNSMQFSLMKETSHPLHATAATR